MLSSLGKLLRKMRIDNGELLKDMADKLKISSSYLSSIEMNQRNIPADFIDRVIQVYRLTTNQAQELKEAARLSVREVKLDLSDKNTQYRDVALLLARNFDHLKEEELEAFRNILKKREGGT